MASNSEWREWLLIIAIALAIVLIDKIANEDQPNNEPYTGLCNQPTSQGGC